VAKYAYKAMNKEGKEQFGIIEADTGLRPRLIINRLRPQMIEQGDMMGVQDILDLLSVDLLGLVPEDETIIISTNQGVPVVHNPRSITGEAYRNIAARLDGQDIPFLTLNGHQGFLSRLKKLVRLS